MTRTTGALTVGVEASGLRLADRLTLCRGHPRIWVSRWSDIPPNATACNSLVLRSPRDDDNHEGKMGLEQIPFLSLFPVVPLSILATMASPENQLMP